MPVYQYPEDQGSPYDTVDPIGPATFPGDPGYKAPGPTNSPPYDSVPNRGWSGDRGSLRPPPPPENPRTYSNYDQNAEEQWVAEHITSKGYVLDQVTGDVYDPKAYPPKVVDHMPDFYPTN